MRTFVCRCCGSDQVLRDAWASWNADSQQWELDNIFDHAYCTNCDGETSITEKQFEPTA